MRVTASKVGLLEHCQYFAGPEAEWESTTSAAAARGTRVHRAIATYVMTGNAVYSGLEGDEASLVTSAMGWVDSFGRKPLAAEVAFAWDPVTDTAERIYIVDRDYSAYADKLCGTADIVAISRKTRTGYIADWKTGRGDKSTPQLRTLALMFARAEDLDTVTVEALEISTSGVNSVCRETLDSFDLAAVAGELAANLALVGGANAEPGPHCAELYCPALATCPAGSAVVAQIIPEENLVRHRWSLTVQGADHALWLLDHARLVEAAAKSVRDAVKAAVPSDGWELEDGRLLRETTRDMPRFDRNKAIALLRSLGATQQQLDSCTYVFKESAGLRATGKSKLRSKKKAA